MLSYSKILKAIHFVYYSNANFACSIIIYEILKSMNYFLNYKKSFLKISYNKIMHNIFEIYPLVNTRFFLSKLMPKIILLPVIGEKLERPLPKWIPLQNYYLIHSL